MAQDFIPVLPIIEWKVPCSIQDDGSAKWDKVNIYRAPSESSEYVCIDTIDSAAGNIWIDTYNDTSSSANRMLAYLIKYYSTLNDAETKWYLTLYQLTPREQRLVEEVKLRLDRFTKLDLTDKEVRGGLQLALQHFNLRSPQTQYTLENFPLTHEIFLILGAQFMTILQKYLDVATRDFSASDSGLSLNIDRGSKMQYAMDKAMATYSELVVVAKLDLAAPMGMGVGTLQLPISLGTNLGANIMNVLNVFNTVT